MDKRLPKLRVQPEARKLIEERYGGKITNDAIEIRGALKDEPWVPGIRTITFPDGSFIHYDDADLWLGAAN